MARCGTWLWDVFHIIKDMLGIDKDVKLFTRLEDFLEFKLNSIEKEVNQKFSYGEREYLKRHIMRKEYRVGACICDGSAIYVSRRFHKYTVLWILVHELLHAKYPNADEAEVIRKTGEVVKQLL